MFEMDTSSLMSGEGKQPAASRFRPSALPRLYAAKPVPLKMAITCVIRTLSAGAQRWATRPECLADADSGQLSQTLLRGTSFWLTVRPNGADRQWKEDPPM